MTKAEILKKHGLTEEQFYAKYPTQEAYIKEFGDGGPIHIKPENRGKFTAYKERTGKTTEEALHSPNAHVRQMANFARNAAKWKHADGGQMNYYNNEINKDNTLMKAGVSIFGNMVVPGAGSVASGLFANGGNLIHMPNASTHEQSPYGGIPIGQDNLVEGNETIYTHENGGNVSPEKYVFSDRLKLGKKSFAQISKDIDRRYSKRPDDKISTEGKNRELAQLQQKQEIERLNKQMQDVYTHAYGGKMTFESGGKFDPPTRNDFMQANGDRNTQLWTWSDGTPIPGGIVDMDLEGNKHEIYDMEHSDFFPTYPYQVPAEISENPEKYQNQDNNILSNNWYQSNTPKFMNIPSSINTPVNKPIEDNTIYSAVSPKGADVTSELVPNRMGLDMGIKGNKKDSAQISLPNKVKSNYKGLGLSAGMQSLAPLFNIGKGLMDRGSIAYQGYKPEYFHDPYIDSQIRSNTNTQTNIARSEIMNNSSLSQGQKYAMLNSLATGAAQTSGSQIAENRFKMNSYNNELLNKKRMYDSEIYNKNIDANEQKRDMADMAISTGLDSLGNRTAGTIKDRNAYNSNEAYNAAMFDVLKNSHNNYEYLKDANGNISLKQKVSAYGGKMKRYC